MTWEGRSCNGKHIEGSSVGVAFFMQKKEVWLFQEEMIIKSTI